MRPISYATLCLALSVVLSVTAVAAPLTHLDEARTLWRVTVKESG